VEIVKFLKIGFLTMAGVLEFISFHYLCT